MQPEVASHPSPLSPSGISTDSFLHSTYTIWNYLVHLHMFLLFINPHLSGNSMQAGPLWVLWVLFTTRLHRTWNTVWHTIGAQCLFSWAFPFIPHKLKTPHTKRVKVPKTFMVEDFAVRNSKVAKTVEALCIDEYLSSLKIEQKLFPKQQQN